MGRFFGRKHGVSSDSPSESSINSDYDDDETTEFQKHDLYKKGIDLMANEKLDDAVRSFELAIRVDPNYVDAWIKKGYALFHLSEYAIAVSSYDRALEIDINNSEAWNLKGLAYYKMKNYDQAIRSCEKDC